MARYGSDFTSGRYTQAGRSDSGMGYDTGYRGEDRWGDFPTGRAERWMRPEGDQGWASRARGFGRDLNESWDSMGHGGGRQDFGDRGYGNSGFRSRPSQGMSGSSFGHMGPRFNQWPSGYSDFDGSGRHRYDREMRRAGGRMGHDYDQDFGDRLRRGWNRFRNEARGWMGGGGYDRGW